MAVLDERKAGPSVYRYVCARVRVCLCIGGWVRARVYVFEGRAGTLVRTMMPKRPILEERKRLARGFWGRIRGRVYDARLRATSV